MIFACDPGTRQSAYVMFDPDAQRILLLGIEENDSLLKMIRTGTPRMAVFGIEVLQSYGMPVGHEVFETCYWIGRFVQAAKGRTTLWPVYRKQVLAHHKAHNDSTIRTAMIARFGKENLTGCVRDIWSALAVAAFVGDRIKDGESPLRIDALL